MQLAPLLLQQIYHFFFLLFLPFSLLGIKMKTRDSGIWSESRFQWEARLVLPRHSLFGQSFGKQNEIKSSKRREILTKEIPNLEYYLVNTGKNDQCLSDERSYSHWFKNKNIQFRPMRIALLFRQTLFIYVSLYLIVLKYYLIAKFDHHEKIMFERFLNSYQIDKFSNFTYRKFVLNRNIHLV